MKKAITALITESITTKQQLLEPAQIDTLEKIAVMMINAYKNGKKTVMFGNGGSASDAQHFAAELVCRFEVNRKALPSLAFTTNTAVLTAIGNDFSYDEVFARQVEALVVPGDVVVGISTSGNSPNVLKGFQKAREIGAHTVGFTGNRECKLPEAAELCFCAPSAITGRIQECHILAIHIICRLIEQALFGTAA